MTTRSKRIEFVAMRKRRSERELNFSKPKRPRNRMSRREKIEAMLADEPTDTFLRYSLAMELEKESEHDRSIEIFVSLMNDEPPYVAAFFMCAQQLVRLQRIDEARGHLRNGIEEARKQGNGHAAGEMSEFLSSLGELGE